MPEKPKLALYWGASCGGCEIAVVNLHERILELEERFDLVFCPCLMDAKKADVEALPDRGIAVTLLNGAVRTSENEEMALLLRRKSRLLVAFGSCAAQGGIPGLANLRGGERLLEGNFLEGPTLDNPERVLPSPLSQVPAGTLSLPLLHDRVRSVAEVTEVDYTLPGCPPEPHRIWEVLQALAAGKLPERGSVVGAGEGTVCRECRRVKEEKRISRLYRSFEIVPDPEKCLLEQGVICMGIATREGCGAPCPEANMPCSGCYGPPEGVADQGCAMIAALGSILETGECAGKGEEEIAARVEALLDRVPAYAGSFYMYGLPGSVLGGRGRR